MARDAQRAKVYAAEGFVRTLFERAAAHPGRALEFFGATMTLPPEARFSSTATVRRYVDDVLALPAVAERWPGATAVTVRTRRGAGAAHWECAADASTIAVPDGRDGAWALRELVVLHELAHHLCRADPPHGPEFTGALCALAESVMGPEAGHVLRVVYSREGVV